MDKELIVLASPSECGKSTTLHMIAVLDEITRGKLYVGNHLVNNIPPKDRDIAIVFQNYELYPHMTLDYKGEQMTARVAPDTTSKTGCEINLSVNPRKLHLFIMEIEKAILD